MKLFRVELLQSFQKGMAFAAGAGLFGALSVLMAQSFTSFQAGEVISAAKINENFLIAAPPGIVAAFNLSSCPTGWVAADGTGGTPDLRGQVVRGLNNFGSAAGTRADGNEDPDGGARALASYQADMFQGHRHYREVSHGGVHDFASSTPGVGNSTWTAAPGSGFYPQNQLYTGNPADGGIGYGTPRIGFEGLQKRRPHLLSARLSRQPPRRIASTSRRSSIEHSISSLRMETLSTLKP